jgi:hypothetical protein
MSGTGDPGKQDTEAQQRRRQSSIPGIVLVVAARDGIVVVTQRTSDQAPAHARRFRFWRAFRDFKHDKPAKLQQVEREFFDCIGER